LHIIPLLKNNYFKGESNWHEKGISIYDEIDNHKEKTININVADFHKHFEVVFIDPSGYLNIASKMSKSTFLRVKKEAKLSIMLLNSKLIDCFQYLFIHDRSFEDCFDAIVWYLMFIFLSLRMRNQPNTYF
jgi:hypothetical protein